MDFSFRSFALRQPESANRSQLPNDPPYVVEQQRGSLKERADQGAVVIAVSCLIKRFAPNTPVNCLKLV